MNILVLAYNFPPLPEYYNGGVIRTVKNVKYLMRQDIRVTVISADNNIGSENSLTREIKGAEIVAIKDIFNRQLIMLSQSLERPSLGHLLFKLLRKIINRLKYMPKNVLIPDRFMVWGMSAYKKASQLIAENKGNIIYATSPPHTPFLVGYYLSIKHRLPLVLDFRDAWIGNPYFDGKLGIKKIINSYLEKKIVAQASLIICATDTHAEELKNKYAANNKTILLPNGFDPEDYFDIPEIMSAENKCHLVYSGGFAGVRTSKFFCKALENLDQTIASKLRITVIGFVGEKDQKFLLTAKNKGIDIRWGKPLPHREVLGNIKSADACLVFIYPEEHASHAIPGKVYEYIALRKPIVVVAPSDGELARLVASYNLGYVIDPYDVTSIADKINLIVNAKIDGTLNQWKYKNSLELFDKYDRKKSALRLYEAMKSLMSQQH